MYFCISHCLFYACGRKQLNICHGLLAAAIHSGPTELIASPPTGGQGGLLFLLAMFPEIGRAHV